MEEWMKIIIGIGVLFLGIFIGEILARCTKEELKSGQRWFKIIIGVSLIVAIVGLISKNDSLLFSFLFIAIVTSRSIKKRK